MPSKGVLGITADILVGKRGFLSLLALAFLILSAGYLLTKPTITGYSVVHTNSGNYCGGEIICECGDIVTESYTMTADLDCSGYWNNALLIEAEDITIDCNGFAINGTGNYDAIYTSYDRTKIKNCQINYFNNGVELSGADNCTLQYNTFNNLWTAVYGYTGDEWLEVSDNDFINVGYGVYIDNDYYGDIIRDNYFNDISQDAVYLYGAEYATITGNTFIDVDGDAVELNYVNNAVVKDNIINDTYSGIYLYNSDDNNITGNNMSNVGYGFYLYEADYNDIGNNQILGTYYSNFGESMSCPLLFAYNSTTANFIADLSKQGSLGIEINGTYKKPLPDDNNIIATEQLQPTDSNYALKITQEYDEISYLDEIRLNTIDHSPEYDVFNSLVRANRSSIYTVSKTPAAPASCIDAIGLDCLTKVISKDNVYTEGYSGITNVYELNLGNLAGQQKIKLIIKSRITNNESKLINEKFVQVIGINNSWQNVYSGQQLMPPPSMPMTYVIDLTNKFPTTNYTIRIGYNTEFMIDYIAVDTSLDQPYTLARLYPNSADLHFRGYSKTKSDNTPDYNSLELTSEASTPSGNFTRYGNVQPLLTAADDKYVIMHHGDEISLNFNYTPVPDGKERDFLFFSFAFYKHASSANGSTVTPLPFRQMSTYPYPANESYPQDPAHQLYLATYNTRQYNDTAQPRISLPYSQGNVVHDNIIIGDSDATGIYLYDEDDTSLLNNNISNLEGGIYVEYSDNIIVQGNRIENTSDAAIVFWSGDEPGWDSTIDSNTLIGPETPESWGIYAEWQSGLRILNNEISGFSNAIELYMLYNDEEDNVLDSTNIHDNCEGLRIDGGTELYAYNITLESNSQGQWWCSQGSPRTGIYIGSSSSIYMQDGTLYRNSPYGIYSEEDSYLEWIGNGFCTENALSMYGDYSLDEENINFSDCPIMQEEDEDAYVCGDTITGNITLTRPIECNDFGNGLQIEADDITIDCNHWAIIGRGFPDSAGIYINGRSGITIKNCDLTSFDTGIKVFNSDSITIQDNNIYQNDYEGIMIDGRPELRSNHLIKDNSVSGNCMDFGESECSGILLQYEDNSIIQDNTVAYNYNGISLFESYSNQILSNKIPENNHFGIRIASRGDESHMYGRGNAIDSNTLKNNHDAGIRVATPDNTITNNLIQGDASFMGYSWWSNYGIYLGESSWVNTDNNLFENNNVSGYYYGIYISSLEQFNITNDDYSNNYYGAYLSSAGTEELNSKFQDSRFNDNDCKGLYSDGSSEISLINPEFLRNSDDCGGNGIENYGIIQITDGDFINNSGYGIYDSPRYIYWNISKLAVCRNNDIYIYTNGQNITFSGGTLELDNCTLTMDDIEMNLQGIFRSLDSRQEGVTANIETEFNFTNTNAGITLYLNNDVLTTIAVAATIPTTTPVSFTASFTALKGIDISVDPTTNSSLTWALIKIYYNDSELAEAGISESTLKIYYYNTATSSWELEPDQGIDTENNFVWAKITHFSTFGVFGTVPSTSVSGGGGGGSHATTYNIALEPVALEKRLEMGDGIRFNYNGVYHTLILNSITKDGQVFISVKSTRTSYIIPSGSSVIHDIDGDGIADLEVGLLRVEGTNAATLSFKLLQKQAEIPPEPIPAVEEIQETIPEAEPAQIAEYAPESVQSPAMPSSGLGAIIILLVIIIIGVYASRTYLHAPKIVSVEEYTEMLDSVIAKAFENGYNKELLKTELIKKGWDEDFVTSRLEKEEFTLTENKNQEV